jgi:hypothetical protein
VVVSIPCIGATGSFPLPVRLAERPFHAKKVALFETKKRATFFSTTANLIRKGTLPTRQDRSVDHGESGVGDDGPRDDSQGPGEVPARR